MKSGNLNFLEPSGPLQACNGTALPLSFDTREGDYLEDRSRWEDNKKVAIEEVVLGCMDWIEVARDRDRCQAPVNVVMNLQVS